MVVVRDDQVVNETGDEVLPYVIAGRRVEGDDEIVEGFEELRWRVVGGADGGEGGSAQAGASAVVFGLLRVAGH